MTTSSTGPTPRIEVGVDVVDVERFGRVLALRGAALADRVFTPAELADSHGRLPRLAARFAAKEAAAKALGTGLGAVGWRDVEVVAGERGRPELRLDGAARALAEAQGLKRWAVSLTHDRTIAVALVTGTAKEAASR